MQSKSSLNLGVLFSPTRINSQCIIRSNEQNMIFHIMCSQNNVNLKFDMVAICNITKNNEKKQTTTPHMLLLMARVLQSPYIRLTEVKNNIKGQLDMNHYPFVVH